MNDASPAHTPLAPVLAEPVLLELAAWREAGWIRHIDGALAAFLCRQEPALDPAVALWAALLAHAEGQGHTCLDLQALGPRPAVTLGFDGDALLPVEAVLRRFAPDPAQALQQLRDCASVVVVPGEPDVPGMPHGRPLVLSGTRLYLQRCWQAEQQVARHLATRLAPLLLDAAEMQAVRTALDRLFGPPEGGPEAAFDWQRAACAASVGAALTLVTGGPGTGKTYTAARLLALHAVLAQGRPQPLRVALAAPTGRAAARLRQSIEAALAQLPPAFADAFDPGPLRSALGPARTLHALLGARADTRAFEHHRGRPLEFDLVIVDEASMIDLELMAGLLEAVPPEAALVLLGDKDQLPPVQAGAVMSDLCHQAEAGRYRRATAEHWQALTGQALPAAFLDDSGSDLAQATVMLRQTRRFQGPIGRVANAIQGGRADDVMQALAAGNDATSTVRWVQAARSDEMVALAVGNPGVSPGGLARFAQAVADAVNSSGSATGSGSGAGAGAGAGANPIAGTRPAPESDPAFLALANACLTAFDDLRILCAVREGPWGVQALNRAVEDALARTGLLHPQGPWYPGRPVMVTRNEAGLGLSNGDTGIVLQRGPGAPLVAAFREGAGVRFVGVHRLPPVETAFAITVHKAQGSEFRHALVVLPPQPQPVVSRALLYTAVTRAREALTVVCAHPQALRAAVLRQAPRFSGLRGDGL